MCAQEVQPHVQAHDDLDDSLDAAAPPDLADRPEVQERLRRRVAAAVIKTHNPPRPGKKCLCVDIDYTFFSLDAFSENAADLLRPHLHELFAAAYAHYDIVIWSATGMKWIDVKLRELGVSSHPAYNITACMDYTSMVTVAAPGHGRAVFDCKPLAVLWARFPGVYTPANTIMLDDLRRNYVLNPQNGLVIRPFKRATTRGKGDRELLKLRAYLLKIAPLESLEGLDHDRWERYAREELAQLEEARAREEVREGAQPGGGGGAAGP
jgi:ubiquitin-like domain-containing CTD phosphatase 1